MSSSKNELDKLIEIASQAVLAAGEYLMSLSDIEAKSTKGKDIKLYADKESEKILISYLKPTSIPILSEESADKSEWKGGLRWIIDPVDGSYNFFKGLSELCCVSVALWDDYEPKLGLVYRFATDDLYLGVPEKMDQGATINGKLIYSSKETDLGQASLATGFPVTTDFSDRNLEKHLSLYSHFKKIRMLGTAALMCSFVGQGSIDVYSERGILIWDIAAALAIVKAAGGNYQCDFLKDYRCNIAAFANSKLSNVWQAIS